VDDGVTVLQAWRQRFNGGELLEVASGHAHAKETIKKLADTTQTTTLSRVLGGGRAV